MTDAERNKLAELEWHLLNETDPAIRREARKAYETFHHCVYVARPGHRGVRQGDMVPVRPGGGSVVCGSPLVSDGAEIPAVLD